MATLYEITDAISHHIPVGEGHQIHVEQYGNPAGLPVLVFHGGPGAGANVLNCRYFNPEKYRIILFSQRGCGLSTPHFDLKYNTTSHLISDIEVIRTQLGIKAWLISGNSWGATLALLYAIAHSDKVLGMVLRGTFLARQQDFEWLYGMHGSAQLFPDYYAAFNPKKLTRSALLSDYQQQLNSSDQLAQIKAAKAWCEWEMVLSGLYPRHAQQFQICDNQSATNLALLELHYFSNQCFIEENYIMNQLGAIKHLPVHLLHGRHDFVTPLAGAYALSLGLNAKLDILNDVGHSSENVVYAQAMRRAADTLYCKAKLSYQKI